MTHEQLISYIKSLIEMGIPKKDIIDKLSERFSHENIFLCYQAAIVLIDQLERQERDEPTTKIKY